MFSNKNLIAAALFMLVVGSRLLGGDGQTKPSQYYLQDDIQYFPSASSIPTEAPATENTAVLGDLLFANVVSVHFIGPERPANPDGSFGGLVAGDDRTHMAIYENYILMETAVADGSSYRRLHAYDEISRLEQRIPPENPTTK